MLRSWISILKNNCANNEIIISGKAADGNAAVTTNGVVNDKDHDFEESSMDTMSCRYKVGFDWVGYRILLPDIAVENKVLSQKF